MVQLFFATSIEIYSASQFYLSLVTGLDVTQNISTAESPDTLAAIKKTFMRRFNLILFSCLLISTYSNSQSNQNSQIEIQIVCGWGGLTSTNINNIHRLVNTKTYILLKLKLFSQNRAEALISVIALRELQAKRVVDLSLEELNQINKIVSWDDKYSVCHTCVEHFEGTVNELLAKENNRVYHLIKSAIFKSN